MGFFLRFTADYPAASTVQLTRNYRSVPAIVAGALQAIGPASLVPGRRLAAVGSPPVPAPGGPAAGITYQESPSEQAEAAWIAATIDRLLGGSSFHSLDTGRADGYAAHGFGLADIAVLYRTDAQAGPIGQALTRAGFPFQKRTHDLLLRRTAVPEIVREMRLADPAAASAAAAGEAGPVAARLAAAARRLAARAAGGCGGLRAVDVLAGAEVLAPLAARCSADLDRFFTEIALGAEADALDPRAGAVTLLTLHAAKGLEFSVVFVAGCERDLLPLWLPGASGSQAGGHDLGEERRLLFVGMTRARTHLFLSCAAERRRHGQVTATGPSPFLAAISPALLARAAPPRPPRPADRQLRLL